MTNTPKPFITFDMDGTLVDFPEKLAARMEKTKHLLPQETHEIVCDCQKWIIENIRELFPEKKVQQIVKKHFKKEYQTDQFFSSLEPYPGVVKTLQELQKQNLIGILTTGSTPESGSHSVKHHTIKKHFGLFIPHKRVEVVNIKLNYNSDIHVDDTYSIMSHSDFPDRKPSRELILMDQPRNHHIIGVPRFFLDKQEERGSIIADVIANKQKK